MQLLTYLFWPNPGTSSYTTPKNLVLLLVCAALIAGYFGIRMWRAKAGPVAKRLSGSWASTSMAFGIIGLILAVARVEGIQYIGMRIWWVVWLLAGIAYAVIQYRKFRARHYEVLPVQRVAEDPYLPRKKKR